MPLSTDHALITAYLNRYAQVQKVEFAKDKHYQHVLVIPAYREPADFLDTLLPSDAEGLLVIVVLNAPDSASPTELEETTKFFTNYTLEPLNGEVSIGYINKNKNIDVLVIDRVSANPIPTKQGVGLARKLGNDLALCLIHAGVITKPWIYNTDADVTLPETYFEVELNGAASLFPFEHIAENFELQEKVDLYELRLRYYVNRLSYAGSPYAFQSLGSAIAISASAYAKVRGFPRRAAGEDFYLLNKLAKTGPITRLQSPVITVAGRYSDRVPFGTGPALIQMAGGLKPYLSYHPAIFGLLATFQHALHHAPGFSESPLHAAPGEILEKIGFSAALPKLNKATNNQTRWRRSLIEWFDGFRTLKFVHEARKSLPDQPLVESVRKILDSCEPPPALLNRLRNLERQQNLTN